MALVADEPVPGIEEENVELLHLTVSRQGPAVIDDLGVAVERRMQLVRQLSPGQPYSEGLGDLDGGDGRFVEPGGGTERVGAGREDAGG